MDKRKASRILFLEGFSQKEIARAFSISENTTSKWAQEDKWREDRVNARMMENNSTQRVMRLIDYQTEALERWVEKMRKEEPDEIRLIPAGNIDGLQKLFSAIRKDSIKFSNYAAIMREFFEFLQHYDLELAKQAVPVGTIFLNEKRKSF